MQIYELRECSMTSRELLLAPGMIVELLKEMLEIPETPEYSMNSNEILWTSMNNFNELY